MISEKHICPNHPEKAALSFCHHCKEYFCGDCLNEGKEYYYCKKKECYEQYLLENPIKTNAENLVLPYSDVFSRILAFLIDGLILFAFNTIITFILDLEAKDIIAETGIFVIFRHPLFIISGLLYFTIMESSSKQATIGKITQNLVVTNLQGERINLLQSFIRNISKILSTIIFLIGYIMAEFTKKKQALHDLIAGTLIIKLSKGALPLEVICSACNESISLSIQERISKEYDCPTCNEKIKVTS